MAHKTIPNRNTKEIQTMKAMKIVSEISNPDFITQSGFHEIDIETMESSPGCERVSEDFLELLKEKNFIYESLHSAMSRLTKEEREIIWDHTNGSSFAKIAKTRRMKTRLVYKTYRLSLDKLKNIMEAMNER